MSEKQFDKFEEYSKYKSDSERLQNFFDNFIKNEEFVKSYQVAPGLAVSLTPLSAGELLKAESVANPNNLLPMDIFPKIRAIGILTRAIKAIGTGVKGDKITGSLIDVSDDDESRGVLYAALLKMPPYILDKMYRFYIETVKLHNEQYGDMEDIHEDIKGF